MDKKAKIYVAGHRGLVGRAICRRLNDLGFTRIVTKTSQECDLRQQLEVRQFFEQEKPEYVFLAAAKVGGIMANDMYKADFMYDNLMIQSNVIQAAKSFDVKKLIFLGSSCIYPKFAPQPLKEEYLLSSALEHTNEAYALAKITGMKLCQYYNAQYGTNFISVMPTNLYGPYDDFNLHSSHVLPALLRKFHQAKLENDAFVEVWGTGKPRREFLYVDDLADICIYLMEHHDYDPLRPFINVGTGRDISIHELANMIASIVGFAGELRFDISKPDGTPRKLLDVSHLQALGLKDKIPLKEGIIKTYQWYQAEYSNLDAPLN